MIKGMHGLFYSPAAEEARAFIRDKLGFEHVDAGGGWLIFKVPAAELGFTRATGRVTRSRSGATISRRPSAS